MVDVAGADDQIEIVPRNSKGSDARITPSGTSKTREAEAAPSGWVT